VVTADKPKRRPLGEGAARAAPTSPHATPPPVGSAPNGPERFWTRWRTRAALVVALALSVSIHLGPIAPFAFPSRFDVTELEGEAAIPVDLLAGEEAPPPPPIESPPPPEPAAAGEKTDGMRDAAPPPRDAAPAPADASVDGAVDAGAGDGAGEGGAEAPDAAMDPTAIASTVTSGPPRIELQINASVIRKHPVGAKMGFLLRGLPQWEDFVGETSIDPVNDVDWILISGPSFIETSRDVVVVHFSTSDAAVDKAVRLVMHKYPHGGAFDAGVPGARAVLAYADRSERVILRPAPHVLIVVPPKDAAKVARQVMGARIQPNSRPGDALYWKFMHPHQMLRELPESITEMRLRVVPHADGSADVLAEGDTPDADSAQAAAPEVARFARRHNDALTSLLTHGLFDHVQVTAEGTQVKARLTASLDQIATVVSLVAGLLGVSDEAPGVPSGAAPSAPVPAPGAPPRLR
jgi:hypothetical protein